MPAPGNLDFSISDGTPGGALNWTRTVVSTATEIGGYQISADGRVGRADGGEWGWMPNQETYRLTGGFVSADVTVGLYDSTPSFAGNPVETFTAWAGAYQFGPNDGAHLEVGVYSQTADLGAGRPMEDIDPSCVSAVFVVDSPPSDLLTVIYGVAPSLGATVALESSGSLPSPGAAATAYYVIERAIDGLWFKLATSPDGAAVTWAGAGSGQHATRTDNGWIPELDKYRTEGFAPGDTSAGTYDSQSAQQADNWLASLTTDYRTAFQPGDTEAAQFDQGTSSAEMVVGVSETTFTTFYPSVPSLFEAPGSPTLPVDGAVLLSVDSGGSLPGGFAPDTTYWIVSSAYIPVGDVTHYELAATKGGAHILATSAGSGVFSLAPDPKFCWPMIG